MKLVSGPMATISHPAFRILVEKFGGCDEYFTEMINAGSLLTNGPFEGFYLDPSPVPHKLVWQLTSKNTELMLGAVQRLLELPGIGIDLNMGCSAPDIYKSGAGIGWMLKDRAETLEMVQKAGKIISEYNRRAEAGGAFGRKRFSVKLRLGDEDFKDEDFFSFCDGLVECGVELLTLHPRTKKEKLTLPPRHEYCQRLAERYRGSGAFVYLNGNVRDFESFDRALAAAPDVAGVMVSRAAVQKPWIFKVLKNRLEGLSAPGLHIDMKKLCLDYIDDVERFQPPEFFKTRLQRFFTYFCMNFQFSHYAQTRLINAAEKGNDELRRELEDFFKKCPQEAEKTVGTLQPLL